MYAALWRLLPGPWWLRAIGALAAATALLVALATWGFPWVDSLIGPQEGTVEAG